MARSDIFIGTDELAARLGEANLVVIDGSYYLSTMGRDAAAEYAAGTSPARSASTSTR